MLLCYVRSIGQGCIEERLEDGKVGRVLEQGIYMVVGEDVRATGRCEEAGAVSGERCD